MIYERGCLRAGEEWVERNLVPVAGVGVALSVLQVVIIIIILHIFIVNEISIQRFIISNAQVTLSHEMMKNSFGDMFAQSFVKTFREFFAEWLNEFQNDF